MPRPRRPARLGPAGQALWRRLTANPQLVFSIAESVTLEAACRQADDVAALEALLESQGLVLVGSTGQPKLSGVPAELRQQRAALTRLVAALAIPEDGETVGRSPAQKRAARAADTRWSRQAKAREGRRHGVSA